MKKRKQKIKTAGDALKAAENALPLAAVGARAKSRTASVKRKEGRENGHGRAPSETKDNFHELTFVAVRDGANGEIAAPADGGFAAPALPAEYDGTEPLKNHRHERFAMLMVFGRDETTGGIDDDPGRALRPWEAYELAFRYGKPSKKEDLMSLASRLMRTHPEIRRRIDATRKELREAVMFRREVVYADTMNKMVGTLEALYKAKSTPRVASVISAIGAKILDETRPAEVAREANAREIDIKAETIPPAVSRMSDEEISRYLDNSGKGELR